MNEADTKNSSLVLVDGSSYLFRAFHALPDLTTTQGQHTGAIRGVTSMVRRLVADYTDAQVVMVFDAKGKNFRHALYPDYKANRPSTPRELQEQIEPIYQIVRAMGLPLVVVDGVEADDVIGTLARQASERGIQTLISTGDKDMAQLVNNQVTLINTMNGVITGPQGVLDKYSVRADQIIDYLALMGDSSDNIPGVPKVGPKTAAKWLGQYGSLQQVIEHADEVKGKVGENLRASLDLLPLSYQLATIKLDVMLDFSLESLRQAPPDVDTLLSLFKNLEFKTWVAELLQNDIPDTVTEVDAQKESGVVEADYQLILEEKEFLRWVTRAAKADLLAVDTETTSLNYMDARLVGLSLSIKEGEAAYIPVMHDYMGAPQQLDRDFVLKKLKPLLEDSSRPKVGQNLKYDMHILANHGINLEGVSEDTMLESYVISSTSRHDLDSLALSYLDHTTIHFEEVAGKGAKQLTFNQVDIEQAGLYAAEDADITLRLHNRLKSKLAKEPELEQVYRDIEIPLVPVLCRIERHGTLIDISMLHQHSRVLGERMLEIEKQAYELAGEEFNLGSPKQLQAILYEKLQLPVLKKTPKGQPSTAEPVLQELALDYPLPQAILEYRSFSKLKSTYTDKLPLQVNPATGRIHTSYHQAVTATGRLSSSNPNLQNIPVRTEEGRKIRQAFIAPPGHSLLAADYSQIELRIMAHLSGDEGLLEAFRQERDVHSSTAAEVFGVAFDAVTAEQRRRAKAINFGLIYGMSAFGLARQLGISRKEAQNYMTLYFARYPRVHDYMDQIRQQAAENGYVETLFGRRLYLPEINSRNGMRRQAAERAAINAPMQGTAADIIKKAMVSVDSWLKASEFNAHVIMQVHDELVLEVPDALIEPVTKGLLHCMSDTVTLDVPLTVDVGVGQNWDQAH